jgi:glycosyltransferase involved in cell wall biosynthesis
MESEKINILHVVSGIADGGLEKVVYTIISGSQSGKFEHFIVVLVKGNNSFLETDFCNLGCKITEFDFDNRLSNLLSIKKNLIQIFKLAGYIWKNRIKIIHSHDFFPAFCARLAAVAAGIFYFYKVRKIFVTLHNSFIWLNKYHHFVNRILALFTAKIICVSGSVLEYSLKHDKINRNKYVVIFNGIEENLFIPDKNCIDEFRREFGISGEKLIIANIGVLSVRKGQKYLVESFRILSQKYDNIVLLIFGSRREHEVAIERELNKMIENYRLNDKVKIINPRRDINRIYNIIDIYVMPSITEGQSLCVIEAMYMERICLLSDIPSFSEMVDEGVNGFLFKSKDVEDLTLKLEYLIKSYRDLNYIGKSARANALKKYNKKKMVANYISLYLTGKLNNSINQNENV